MDKDLKLNLDVLNVKGEKAGSVDLSPEVFGVKASPAVVHEVVTAYLANRRRGTHSTKTRGDVSGGGLKPWKQKHTGRARAGSIRSPLWRHGGIIFGPKPRSYFQPVSSAKRQLALKAVLSDFARRGRLQVIDAFSVTEPKTKQVAEIFKKMNWPEKTVLVIDEINPVLRRAAGNVAHLRLCRVANLNSYDALSADQLVLTRPALDILTKRMENGKSGGEPATEASHGV
jgi:large subunit ribosomal protein L4